MIVNINPSRDMFDESQHVLNFSAIAKEILVVEKPKLPKKNRFSLYLEQKQKMPKVEEENDEREEEMNRLKSIITDLYNELESKKREFEVEMHEEREHVKSCYKAIIRDLKQDFEAEMKAMKEQHRVEMESLRSRKLRVSEKEVISVDSSTDEEQDSEDVKPNGDFSSLRKSNVSSRSVDRECKMPKLEDSARLQREVDNLRLELQERNEVEAKLRGHIEQLEGTVKTLTGKVLEQEGLLKDAEVMCEELRQELKEEKRRSRRMIAELFEKEENQDDVFENVVIC